MANHRKEAEEFIYKYIGKIAGPANVQIWKDRFESMSDKEFTDFLKACNEGKASLAVITPNLSDVKIDINTNFAVAEELGHKFFERIWIDEGNDIPAYLSNDEYLIVIYPIRRQAQMLEKKISIPADTRTIDDLTGQPSGPSKGSAVSLPEIQIMAAQGMDNNLTELLKFRGGDEQGYDAMNKMISRTGGASIDALMKLNTRVKSTDTLSTYLTCMHLENTL